MDINYKNHEGYSDPTAFHAIRSAVHCGHDKTVVYHAPEKVYICSPYRGDIEINIANARRYCRIAYDSGKLPIAPHLYFPQFLDDDNEAERRVGISLGLEALRLCSEIWVCGGTVTQGMAYEITEAKRLGIRIRYIESEGIL